MPIGKSVVIIGGDIQGCELAEFLVKRGRKVAIVESGDTLGQGLVDNTRTRLLWWLARKGVKMFTRTTCVEINGKGLNIKIDGESQLIEADTVIPSLPLKPNSELRQAIEGKVPEVYVIGDCAQPGLILEAISDGSRVGHAI